MFMAGEMGAECDSSWSAVGRSYRMAPPPPPLVGDLVDRGRMSTGVLSSSSLSCDEGVSFSIVKSLYGDVGVVVSEDPVMVVVFPVVVVVIAPIADGIGIGPTGEEVGIIWSGLLGDIMNCIGPSYACTSRPFRLTPDIGRTS